MKKIRLTVEDLFEIPTAVIYNPDELEPLESVSIDSRNISHNALFIAVKGEKFDGHDFVSTAVQHGASAVLISEEKYANFEKLNVPVITVKDTVKALGDCAKIWRRKLKTKVIAITGSTGKTTTKEMLALLLNEKYTVNKTIANNNNHIGVPLTIFSTNNAHDVLVAELGTNHFGEIKYTADIISPDYALITNIGHSHLEFLKNRRGVLKEKIELLNSAAENKGFIFINNDDPLLRQTRNMYKKKLSFGFGPGSDVKGRLKGFSDDGRSLIEIRYKKKKINAGLPLFGEQGAKNFLAASAVALRLGVSVKQITEGIKKIAAVDKRLDVKKFPGFLLIDDTYNANPDSMRNAIELLAMIKGFKRKIAVLGDMFELGEKGPAEHKKLAKLISKNKISEVYATGTLMKNLFQQLTGSKIEVKYFKEKQMLGEFLKTASLEDSVLLVKGSRGMKMEEFVKIIESGR